MLKISGRGLLLGLLTLVPAFAFAADEPDPAAYRADIMNNKNLNSTGEGYCWHASYSAGDFLMAYHAYNNVKWLEEAETYYDGFVSKLAKDPDGFEGWIGPQDVPGCEEDALVGDSILCGHLASFAEIVLKDKTLKERFGAKAQKYVDLCTRIIWEKWNQRGCYYQDAAGWGTYHTHDKTIDVKTGKWVEHRSMMSQPLNKNISAAMVLLRLWRINGKPEFRERVERLIGRCKMTFLHFTDEDRLAWPYWVPHGPYDIEGKNTKHWVGVHPNGGYQSYEVASFVELFESGLVFDQADMERLVHTNLWMLKGDGKTPIRSSDGAGDGKGLMWTPLARWDETIRKKLEDGLAGKSDATSKINQAFLKNVTEKHLNWDRLYVTDAAQVKIAQQPLQSGKSFMMALAIPNSVETAAGGKICLATKTYEAGTIKIELLDAAGKDVLGSVGSAESAKGETVLVRWDGTNPKTGKKDDGEYRVRWTLNGDSRMEPVWVKQGTKRELTGPAPLAPGQRITVDFEGELDARWHLEGASLTDEQAHGGKKSLKIPEGKSALLSLDDKEDLPVKVTLWVFDIGKKLGKTTKTGVGWGIKTGDGDTFCVRTCWRTFMGGDDGYAWFNTAEERWASPHWAGINRKDGWSEWVFDFSNPSAPKVTADGKPISNLVPKFTPKGAAELYVLGGDGGTGTLYIDDISIEYPGKL